MKRSTPTLFIFRPSGASCSGVALHWALHGQCAIRTSADEFGRVVHKTYEYPGIPHFDVIPGVIAVEPRHERRVVETFEKYGVPHLRAKVKGCKALIGMPR